LPVFSVNAVPPKSGKGIGCVSQKRHQNNEEQQRQNNATLNQYPG